MLTRRQTRPRPSPLHSSGVGSALVLHRLAKPMSAFCGANDDHDVGRLYPCHLDLCHGLARCGCLTVATAPESADPVPDMFRFSKRRPTGMLRRDILADG